MLHKKMTTHYHMVIPTFLMLFLVLGIIVTVYENQQTQDINTHAASTNCTVNSTKLSTKSQEQTLLNEINTYRTQNNLGALTMNNTLKQSSEWLSLDMIAHNTLSHVDSLNRTPDVRLSNCGYTISNGYGENIADGSNDPTAVFNAWKNDPPHNQILLTHNYNITGISMELNSSGVAFWTMDLGFNAANPTPTDAIFPTPTTATTITAGPTVTISPTVIPTAITTISPAVSAAISPTDSTTFPSPTIGPVTADMQIAVSVNINGIGQQGNPNPIHKTRKVVAMIYDWSNTLVTTGTAFLNYDGTNNFTGTIHLGKLSQGPYFIKLVSDFTLQVLAKPEFQNLMVNKLNTIPSVTLYQGDMNADNILDITDYNLVLPCFQSLSTCANANQIDFNDDGVTDVRDYNLLLNSFELLHGD